MKVISSTQVFDSRSDKQQSKTYGEPFGCSQDKLRRTIENRKWVGIFAIVVALTDAG